MQHEQSIDYKAKYEQEILRREEQDAIIIQLRFELGQLKRMLFGAKHERFVPAASPDQLALSLDRQSATPPAPSAQAISYTRRKAEAAPQKPSRQALPAHLVREQVVIEPTEDISGLKKIGEDITEELDYTPGKLFVRQYVRPKYARENGEGVLTGELPVRPIEKGIAGGGLLAQILIDKYCDHLPVYRQPERFKREGVQLASSTVGDWISASCTLLTPLYDTLKKQVLHSTYIQADETPIAVLDKTKKGNTHQGYYWVYHAPQAQGVLFDYRPGRGRDGPTELLSDFTGYLQTDGYAAYDVFGKREGITVLNCMAHARRKFEQALENDAARAEYVLTKMQQLYAAEREGKGDVLLLEQLRRERALPVLEELERWMREQLVQVTPKSPIGEAIAYTLPRWQKLCRYTTDTQLLIDNNRVENTIRPVAVGRKNYLFAGSHSAAQRAAMIYSLLGTCKLHGVNPFVWLRNVLEVIPVHPANRLAELLPQNFSV
ncbi:MAG: IS66 family transposase [Bacteroidota bacterium]|jgi:transposase